MRNLFSWVRLTPVAILVALATAANAGIDKLIPTSVQFEGGQSVVTPGSPVQLRLRVESYRYGSEEFSYVGFAVVPADPARNASWTVYAASSKPTNVAEESLLSSSAPYRLDFKAPLAPGKYKVVMGNLPLFVNTPLKSAGPYKQAFEPSPDDRNQLVYTMARGGLQDVATFEVTATPPQRTTLKVYLRMNGTQLHLANLQGGLQEKPILFTWSAEATPSLPVGDLEYRYRLAPSDDAWGIWTKAQQASYSFLQKGVHQFQVQARYVGVSETLESQPAGYTFELPRAHVSKPTKSPQPGPADPNKRIEFKNVYAKSRALLVGMWQFEDGKNFPSFEKAKIQKDLAEMDSALRRHGFDVVKVQRERVSRDDIVRALSELVASAQRDDRLFVYFSSHGFADPGSPADGYLATSDCKYDMPAVRCLRLKDLENYADKALKSQNAKQVLFAIDSCFSGLGVVRKASPSSAATDLSQLAVPKGAYMLTAGMSNQKAEIDPKLGMSTFTHYLAEGLNGGADLMGNDGLITLGQLYVYVQFKVAKQSGTKQIPMLGRISGDGEMLFWPPKR